MKNLFLVLLGVFMLLAGIALIAQTIKTSKKEYQIDVQSHGYTIYDGSREVGYIPYYKCPTLDSIIVEDNL